MYYFFTATICRGHGYPSRVSLPAACRSPGCFPLTSGSPVNLLPNMFGNYFCIIQHNTTIQHECPSSLAPGYKNKKQHPTQPCNLSCTVSVSFCGFRMFLDLSWLNLFSSPHVSRLSDPLVTWKSSPKTRPPQEGKAPPQHR